LNKYYYYLISIIVVVNFFFISTFHIQKATFIFIPIRFAAKSKFISTAEGSFTPNLNESVPFGLLGLIVIIIVIDHIPVVF
jgi:hypothetical protein